MSNELGSVSAATIAAIAILSAVMSVVLILLLIPWLSRYVMARPNARSSHTTPTPQGGGIAVVAATIVAAYGASYPLGSAAAVPLSVVAAVILMACLGAADDIRAVDVVPRLVVQTLAVSMVVYALPQELRVIPFLPWWIVRALLVLGGVWFVNLVNFMDGIDWMSVAEAVPLTAALTIVGWLGDLPPQVVIVAPALCGAMMGFAYFNRPLAKLFLGDVGSLTIGLLLVWLLLQVAIAGHLAAAILMPLYYLADATVTLLRRLTRGEPIWKAHRMHFYQLATDRGFTVIGVVARVFVANVGLSALAVLTVIVPSKLTDAAALLSGAILVTLLLFAFSHGRK